MRVVEAGAGELGKIWRSAQERFNVLHEDDAVARVDSIERSSPRVVLKVRVLVEKCVVSGAEGRFIERVGVFQFDEQVAIEDRRRQLVELPRHTSCSG